MMPKSPQNSSSNWQTIEDFLDSRYRAANPEQKVDLFLDEFKQHAIGGSMKLDFDFSSFGQEAS